jgi:hypothetical protein
MIADEIRARRLVSANRQASNSFSYFVEWTIALLPVEYSKAMTHPEWTQGPLPFQYHFVAAAAPPFVHHLPHIYRITLNHWRDWSALPTSPFQYCWPILLPCRLLPIGAISYL